MTADMHGEGGSCDAHCLNTLLGNCQPDDLDCFDKGGGGPAADYESGLPSDASNNPLVDIFETIIHDDFQAFMDTKCFTQSPGTIDWTNSKCVDAFSFLTQDIATLFSSTSATWTTFLTLAGCVAGLEGLEGFTCSAGYGIGWLSHKFFFNQYESAFSGISFFATAYSDWLTHDTYANSWDDWEIGEDTKTGLATNVAGLAVEPFTDAAIDLYASGYNHGYFCGISTLAACIESLISDFP